MAVNNLQTDEIAIKNVGINLATSPYFMEPGEAQYAINIDFSEDSGAITGRYGTTTLKPSASPAVTLGAPPLDIFEARKSITEAWLIATYSDGANQKIVVYIAGTPHDLETAAGAVFSLTKDIRINFENAGGRVYGTNGVDDPFYIDLSLITTYHCITSFTTIRKFVAFKHWDDRLWGWNGLDAQLDYSDSDDYTKFAPPAAGENSGFIQCPGGGSNDPVRACMPARDKMHVFKADQIGYAYNTGSADAPYVYGTMVDGPGTIGPRTVAEFEGDLVFLDKTPPYVFIYTGNQIISTDPMGKIGDRLAQYIDVSDYNNFQIIQYGSRIIVMGKTTLKTGSEDVGLDGKRWMIVISTNRFDGNGNRYYPWGFWKLPGNSMVVRNDGASIGRFYIADTSVANGGLGTGFIWVLGEDYDKKYGDYNDTGTASDKKNILYQLTTGFWGGSLMRRWVSFNMEAGWDGSPAVSHTIASGTCDSVPPSTTVINCAAGDFVTKKVSAGDYVTVTGTGATATVVTVSSATSLITTVLTGGDTYDGGDAFVIKNHGNADYPVDTLKVDYKIDHWTSYKTIGVNGTIHYNPVPFPGYAVGRKIMFDFYVLTMAFRPRFHGYSLDWQPMKMRKK
jgi:hypothetical protein